MEEYYGVDGWQQGNSTTLLHKTYSERVRGYVSLNDNDQHHDQKYTYRVSILIRGCYFGTIGSGNSIEYCQQQCNDIAEQVIDFLKGGNVQPTDR